MNTVLFTQKKSVYHYLGNNCYDVERNALSWQPCEPSIYHPPCRSWGRLRGLSSAPSEEYLLAVWSIINIRNFGGVLEHPVKSKLWEYMGLPLPGKIDSFGGFTISINQHWFGHKAKKNTFLYICGISPKEIPPYPLNFNSVNYVIGRSKGSYRPEVSKYERSATPVKLAIWLNDLIDLIKASNKC